MMVANLLLMGPKAYFSDVDLSITRKLKALGSVWVGSGTKDSRLGGRLKCEKIGRREAGVLVRVSASVLTAEKPLKVPDIVLKSIKEIFGTVKLPGSKSLSNWILLLAALFEICMEDFTMLFGDRIGLGKCGK